MPSDDDLLFAEHVVKAGFLTREEVEESLSVQARMDEMGVRESLRAVLVKRGALREADAAIVARNAGLRSGGEPIPGYTLESRLGTGAMGSVYKAWQKGMKRHVAIKILRRDLTDDPRQVERLQREAALVGKLDHPNIVRGLDSGETDGLVWFVMEIVEGETLRERIARLSRIEPEEAIRITRQLAEALDHATGHGVVHRDVKPGNILIARDGTPRLTDYGLAKGETDDALTQFDATLGTPQYISPEQAKNPRDADIRSDIYSLGATLYAMLSGHPPFAGETMAATLTKVLYERPKPIADEAPGVPSALAYLVERMMAKDRRHRYQTPQELLRDLRALEAGRLTVPSGFRGDIVEYVETRRHRRLWLTGAALLAVAAALAMGVREWERRGTEDRRREAASHELASLRQRAGPPEAWDPDTVGMMLKGYERLSREYAGTPAAEDALSDLRHWTAQDAELRRANDLALRAGNPQESWPRLLLEIAQRREELRIAADATVAYRRVVALEADRREARDRHAAPEIDKAKAVAAGLPLEQAAARFAALAETLRNRFYGDEASPLVTEAAGLSARFRDAAAALDRAFASYERVAGPDGGLARGEFRSLQGALERSYAAAQADAPLAALLAALPPAPGRAGAVRDRYERLLRQLGDQSVQAWEKARRDATDLRDAREFAGAAALLEEFAARALDPEREKATTLRSDVLRLVQDEVAAIRLAADEAAGRFVSALRRRDYPRARDTLEELRPVGASARSASNPATELVDAGGRLLDLVERFVTVPLRARLGRPGPLEGGLRVRKGQGFFGYSGVQIVRLDARTLTFVHEDGQTESCSLDDIHLDDVLRHSGLEAVDAEHAAVIAALRLVEHQATDAVEGLRQLQEVSRLLDTARPDAALRPLTQRLAALRDDLERAARDEISEAERRAEIVHRSAEQALAQERYDKAIENLRYLLETKSYARTEYVKKHREEIVKQRELAVAGQKTSSFAQRFPGAACARFPDGSGEVFFDFESPLLAAPEARKVLSLVEGRTEIDSRPAVFANRPDLLRPTAAPALPLVLEHVLAWRAADDAAGPREFPVSIACPFDLRKRVEVSFLYRSESPFFLAVSVGGATVGVLSSPDNPYGGRGIEFWTAADLDRPDRAFDDRHRSAYLARHPEVLKKEGERHYFCFEPGRTYRVRFVKDERRGSLVVDEQVRWEGDCRPGPGNLEGRIVLASFSAGEVDDLRISGTLDAEWLRGR